MSELYYLQDNRQFVGNSMLWWRTDGAGYCCDVREAHVYTKDEAFSRHRSRSTDIPWPKAYIDARVSHHVDFQRVKLDEADVQPAPETPDARAKAEREVFEIVHRGGLETSDARPICPICGKSDQCPHEGNL